MAKPRQAALLVLTEIEQLRAISDPLRARILASLAREEQTTKQVADRLGEKATKLYHHVETLEKAGLVRMTRTRQNRGTLEKYFIGVARRFEVGEALLGDGQAPDALTTMIDTLLDQTRNECHRLAAGDSPLDEVLKKSGLLSFIELHADQATIDRLGKKLHRLVAELSQEEADESSETEEAERAFRLLVAFYPLDRFPDA